MYVCMHVCMYVCVYVCMPVCEYGGMEVWRYVCMYACMYVSFMTPGCQAPLVGCRGRGLGSLDLLLPHGMPFR